MENQKIININENHLTANSVKKLKFELVATSNGVSVAAKKFITGRNRSSD